MSNLRPDVRRLYQLDRYSNIREAGIEYLGGVCEICGTDELLEFDHIDPLTKTANLSSVWTNAKRFFNELLLCQLLCYNCHKQKSRAERSVDHGEGLSGKRNCKCEPCRQRKNEYMRVYLPKYRALHGR